MVCGRRFAVGRCQGLDTSSFAFPPAAERGSPHPEGFLCLPMPYPESTATHSQPQGKGQQLAGDLSSFPGLLSVYIIVV